MLETFLSVEVPIIVAGMFGGMLRWALFRPKVWDGLVSVAIGGGLAYYLSDYAVVLLAPALSGFTAEIPNIQRLSGLIVGLIGIGLAGFILEMFNKLRSNRAIAKENET